MSRPLATVDGAKKMVKKLYPSEKDDSVGFKEKVILLVSTFTGTNMKELAKVIGYPRKVVEEAAKNFKTLGVWQKNNTVTPQFMKQKDGGYKFFLQSVFK